MFDFRQNDIILFEIPPLKAQNYYMLRNILGVAWPPRHHATPMHQTSSENIESTKDFSGFYG